MWSAKQRDLGFAGRETWETSRALERAGYRPLTTCYHAHPESHEALWLRRVVADLDRPGPMGRIEYVVQRIGDWGGQVWRMGMRGEGSAPDHPHPGKRQTTEQSP